MGIRKRLVVAATVLGGLVWWFAGRGDDATQARDARDAATSRASRSIAEFVATLPTPAQLKLHPIYIEVGELRLEGQAIDGATHPVAGATITLNGTQTTVTEGDGSFAFEHLAAADYRITAEKGALYAEDSVTVYDGADPATLEMKPGTKLVVHVVAEHDAPVADAKVECDIHTGITDRTGTVTFKGVDFSSARIEVVAKGFASLRTSVPTGDDPSATIEKTFVLHRGATVGGLVVDQDGVPVPEASVMLHASAGNWADAIDSDATGRWHADGIGAGKISVNASSNVHIATPDLVVPVDGIHDRTDLIVKVDLGLELAGSVVDRNGAPIADARVSAEGGYARTDDHGRFAIKGLKAGPNEVSANTETQGSEAQKIVVARGVHPDVRIVLVDSSIAGTVKNRRGEPVEDVSIYAHEIHDHGSGFGHTDELGKWDLGGLAPGDYELVATRKTDQRDSPKGVVVHTGNRRVALVVPDVATIVGRVVLDGAPVDYFGVVVSDDPDATWYRAPDTLRVTDGRFTESDLRPGTAAVIIVGPAFMKKVIKNVQITEGKTTDLGDITVDRGRSVSGRVTDERGRPIAGALVAVSDGRSIEDETTLRPLLGATRTAKSDDAGNYRVDGIAADATDLRIGANAEHGIAQPRPLDPTAKVVDLIVARPGSLEGTVTNVRGNISAYVMSLTGELTFYASIDDTGEFQIERLPPGEYSVELHGKVVAAPIHVAVTADAAAHVTFELPPTAVTVALRYPGCKHIHLEADIAPDRTTFLDSADCTADAVEFADVTPGSYSACAEYTKCMPIVVALAPSRQVFTIVVPEPPPEPEPVPDTQVSAPDETAE